MHVQPFITVEGVASYLVIRVMYETKHFYQYTNYLTDRIREQFVLWMGPHTFLNTLIYVYVTTPFFSHNRKDHELAIGNPSRFFVETS